MDEPVTVTELLPPAGDASPTDEHLAAFESAVDSVIEGRWDEAIDQLQSLPEEGPRSFLEARMAEFDNSPPADWDGAFSLAKK